MSDYIIKEIFKNDVKNNDIRYRKFDFIFSIKLALLFIILGVIFDNPANSINFSIYPLIDAIRLSLRSPIIMLGGIILGPLWGALIGGVIDITSFLFFNSQMDFMIIFTLISMFRGFLAGFIYNYLYNKLDYKAIIISLLVPHVILSGFIIPLALYYSYNVPFINNVIMRLKIQSITLPIYIIGVYYILKGFKKTKDLKTVHSDMKKLLKTDELTNLANRRYFMEFYKKIFTLAKRHKQPLTLLMLDLDNFKEINDNYGHNAGDKYLKKVGEILNRETRNEDLAARLGGDEFIILLPETDINKAYNFAERIKKNISKINLKYSDIPLTVSIGVADLYQNDSVESFLKRVDDALYIAKDKGRNRVEKYITEVKSFKIHQEI